MERAGGDAVEIGDVGAADAAKSIEIEMGVPSFERIEGPLDETDPAAESVFALEKFEKAADTAIAMRSQDSGHVGVKVGSVIVKTDERFGETDQGVAVESAEDLAASVMGDNKGDVGFGVEFVVAPDFAGDGDAAVEFVESAKGTDGDVGDHGNFQL